MFRLNTRSLSEKRKIETQRNTSAIAAVLEVATGTGEMYLVKRQVF